MANVMKKERIEFRELANAPLGAFIKEATSEDAVSDLLDAYAFWATDHGEIYAERVDVSGTMIDCSETARWNWDKNAWEFSWYESLNERIERDEKELLK